MKEWSDNKTVKADCPKCGHDTANARHLWVYDIQCTRCGYTFVGPHCDTFATLLDCQMCHGALRCPASKEVDRRHKLGI